MESHCGVSLSCLVCKSCVLGRSRRGEGKGREKERERKKRGSKRE